jgi:hypothetical protein
MSDRDPTPLRALERAVQHVVAAQRADGAWCDFELDGTPSDAWVTAYVGLGLAAAAPHLARPLDEPLARARAFLFRSFADRAGWGFNGRAPVDADSTAFGITFTAAGGGAPPAAYATLRRHAHADGGFSCYERFSDVSTWAVSHVDVSAMVLRALLTESQHDANLIARAVAFLAGAQAADGSWPSYWYASPVYSVAATLDALRRCGPAALACVRVDDAVRFAVAAAVPNDPFVGSLALAVVAAFGAPDDVAAPLAALVGAQRIDGRFTAGAPFMRPDPWNYAPADPDAAILDGAGLFTTATALRALSAVVARAPRELVRA